MPTATYNFATDDQGWRTWDGATQTYQSGQVFYSVPNQNIATVDADQGAEIPYLVTPSSFAGDQSDLIGGTFQYSWTNSDPTPSGSSTISCQSQSKMGPCRGVKMGHFG